MARCFFGEIILRQRGEAIISYQGKHELLEGGTMSRVVYQVRVSGRCHFCRDSAFLPRGSSSVSTCAVTGTGRIPYATCTAVRLELRVCVVS